MARKDARRGVHHLVNGYSKPLRFAWPESTRPVLVPPPAGFGWAPPLTIYKTYEGDYTTTFDVQTYAPTGAAYYVDSATGNDGWPGTLAQPLKGIDAAIAKADVVVVYIKPGVYHRGDGLGATISKNIALRRWPGESGRIIIPGDVTGLVFAQDPVFTNCYKVTTAWTIEAVIDHTNTDADGDYVLLTEVADLATCDATNNSWIYTGGVLYVNRTDDAEPTINNTWACTTTNSTTFSGDYTWYMEYIDIVNGMISPQSTAGGQTPTLYMYDCTVKFHQVTASGQGVYAQGAHCYTQDCEFAKNYDDGILFIAKDGNNPHVIEINARSYKNGLNAIDTNNQGSSAHEGYAVLLNCEFWANVGAGILDLNGKSWCLGCNIHDSNGGGGTDNCNYGSATGPMWVDGCISSGSTYDLRGNVYYRNLTSGGNNVLGGTYLPY